jgi:hypothetical protein
MVKQLLITLALSSSIASYAIDNTSTAIFNPSFKTLQLKLNDNEQQYPIMLLDGNDVINISFDELAEDRTYLRYELIHCNALWQPSGLVDNEFLEGFNIGDINDYRYSQSTSVHYVHYQLDIPNEQVAPKISGNYLLRVYPETDYDTTLLQCRFMVSEQVATLSAELSSRTDIDYNDSHQQLSLTVDTERANVDNPFTDLTVVVSQNNRADNVVTITSPTRTLGKKALYEHMSPLIFPAGNEYRRVETISVTYPGMGVQNISYASPFYHITLATDSPRNELQYSYDQTQHGRFKIREYNSDDSDVDADYVVTHFSLDMPQLTGFDIYLDGDFTHRLFNTESLMTYNRETGLYEKALLLKQGAYNYQYLAVPKGSHNASTSTIEGDFYQTINEYLVKVYNHRPGERYDRLISVGTIFFNK